MATIRYRLRPGDSILFDSGALHGPETTGQAADDLPVDHCLPEKLKFPLGFQSRAVLCLFSCQENNIPTG